MRGEEIALDTQLFNVMALVLKGDARDILMKQESGHGLACWQLLAGQHEPKSAGHQRAKLVEILRGSNLTGTWRAKLAQWESLVRDLRPSCPDTGRRGDQDGCVRGADLPT